MIRRYAAGTAAGATLLVSVTGCLGDAGGKKGAESGGAVKVSAVAALARASQQTGSSVDSYKATIDMTGSFHGQKLDMNGDLQTRIRPELGLNMTIKNMNMAGNSVGSMQEILTGDAVYLKIPMLSQSTGGKPWIKMSLSKLGAKSGIDVKQLLSQAQQADPATSVKMLTASTDADRVGTEDINGVSTTHYTGTYSTKEALAKLSSKQREQAQSMIDQLGLSRLHFDVWVDGQNLPRKLVSKSMAGAAGQVKMTMIYTDFNKSVSVNPPPADETTDGSQLLGGTRMPG